MTQQETEVRHALRRFYTTPKEKEGLKNRWLWESQAKVDEYFGDDPTWFQIYYVLYLNAREIIRWLVKTPWI